MVPQLCMMQAKKAPVIAPGCFMIEQQGQPLGMAETGGVAMPSRSAKAWAIPVRPSWFS
jgi:hypothetical protein